MSYPLVRWVAFVMIFALFATSVHADSNLSLPEPIYDGKRLTEWLEQLKSPRKEDQEKAAEAIGRLVNQSQDVAHALVASLVDKDGKLNEANLRAVTALGPTAVPALTRALWDQDKTTRAS